MKVGLHPEADAELQAAAQWYEDRSAGLGERFLSEALNALEQIARRPKRFAKVPSRSRRDFHRKLLPSFPYAVVYEIKSSGCAVLAVAHVRRRPGYWRGRAG